MNNLPVELLSIIGEHADLRTLENMRQTCKKFNQVLKPVHEYKKKRELKIDSIERSADFIKLQTKDIFYDANSLSEIHGELNMYLSLWMHPELKQTDNRFYYYRCSDPRMKRYIQWKEDNYFFHQSKQEFKESEIQCQILKVNSKYKYFELRISIRGIVVVDHIRLGEYERGDDYLNYFVASE